MDGRGGMNIPFLPSPNHHAGRSLVTPGLTSPITDIVVHWMDGTLAAADATFANPAQETSAHYGVEGSVIHQYVADADTAWHSGDWNENQRSIGIEHSAQPGRDASLETIATSVNLMVGLCRKHGIDPSHIYPHNRFYATQCPGTLPVAAMVAAARAQLDTTTPTVPMEDTMRPWFIRAKSGTIVCVSGTGARALTPAQWQVFVNSGEKVDPNYLAMDPGPFQAVIASLGGLQH